MLTCKKYNSDYILITNDNDNNKDFLNSIGNYTKINEGWLVSTQKYKKIKNLISEINNIEFFKKIKRIKQKKAYYRSKSPRYESSSSESSSESSSSESDNVNFNVKSYLNNSDEESTSESDCGSSSDDSDFPEPISPKNRKSEINQIKSNHRRRKRFIKELGD